MVASRGGLADIGLVGVDVAEPRRTRSYDDDGATQVLPLGTTTAPPPAAPTPEGDRGRGAEQRRPWPLVLGAALALVIAVLIAFAIGMNRGGADDATESPSAPDTEATSPSASTGAEPTQAGMIGFIEDYIATASSDPTAAFDMLTPSFQEQSHGLTGYEDFWGDVRNTKILDVSADPASLEVSYTYRYLKPPGPPQEDDVVLKLTFENGTYLIDQEL
jgi:eukaryotic-like serine/threonine-protein kinase